MTMRPLVRPRLDAFFAPAASPGHIWLERIYGDLGEGGRASVWQVSVRTAHRGPVISLPRNSSLVAGTGAGQVVRYDRNGSANSCEHGGDSLDSIHQPRCYHQVGMKIVCFALMIAFNLFAVSPWEMLTQGAAEDNSTRRAQAITALGTNANKTFTSVSNTIGAAS